MSVVRRDETFKDLTFNFVAMEIVFEGCFLFDAVTFILFFSPHQFTLPTRALKLQRPYAHMFESSRRPL